MPVEVGEIVTLLVRSNIVVYVTVFGTPEVVVDCVALVADILEIALKVLMSLVVRDKAVDAEGTATLLVAAIDTNVVLRTVLVDCGVLDITDVSIVLVDVVVADVDGCATLLVGIADDVFDIEAVVTLAVDSAAVEIPKVVVSRYCVDVVVLMLEEENGYATVLVADIME